MKSYEERRDEKRKYEADIAYDIWRRGGNPDYVHPDRIDNYWYQGVDEESAVNWELRRQREARERREQEEQLPEEKPIQEQE